MRPSMLWTRPIPMVEMPYSRSVVGSLGPEGCDQPQKTVMAPSHSEGDILLITMFEGTSRRMY